MVIKNRIIMKVFYYIICAACFVGCVSSSNDKTVKENGRTLHNGIVLPEQWPPSMIDDGVRREMSLPYISNKPTVISVNLGRQLFVDDFLIAETDMERVSHKAMFYENNPVLAPDKEWEYTFERAPYAAPFSDGIWYDESEQNLNVVFGWCRIYAQTSSKLLYLLCGVKRWEALGKSEYGYSAGYEYCRYL